MRNSCKNRFFENARFSSSDTASTLEKYIDNALSGSISKVPDGGKVYKSDIVNTDDSKKNQEGGKQEDDKDTVGDVITSPFGERVHPVTKTVSFHGGIDFRAPLGSEIKAWEDGVVKGIGSDSNSGLYIILKHDNKTKTSYSHLSKFFVTRGQSVSKGQVIGLSGKSGRATGPHLHFRMDYNGSIIDPTSYVSKSDIIGNIIGETNG